MEGIMVPDNNDLLRKLQDQQNRLKKIMADDHAEELVYEQNTLANLQKSMERLRFKNRNTQRESD